MSSILDNRTEKGDGFAGEQRVVLPARALAGALRQEPLLRGLLAAGAGYFPKAAGHLRRRPQSMDQAIFIYCLKGGGWCRLAGQLHPVRAGDLLVVPPDTAHTYGAHPSNPWTIHWVHAAGGHLGEYLRRLGATAAAPVLPIGEDLQLTRLFHEVVKSLQRGFSFPDLLQASHALAHLLALLIRHRHDGNHDVSDAAQKAAQSIVYMSEHLDQPLRVTELAALANVSPTHFTVLFKEQTGCSPREYLHLLRIHRACQLLHDTAFSVKDIAARLGYQDPFHFSRQFKAFQGLSPSEYRASPGA